MQRLQTSKSASQNKFDRSYRGFRNELGESYITPGSARPGTPGQNALARPPSSSVLFNQGPLSSARLNTVSSNSSGPLNTGFSLSGQMNISMMDRPITQHGLAGIRPGTGRGLSMTRQIQDKRYYIGLIQLKIRELNHEIAVIMKDIEDLNKERATYLHNDRRAKNLAAELTALQGQLADYNIVVDKMTSNIGKEEIEQETEELAAKNEEDLLKIESMFEERKRLEQNLNRTKKQLENEQKRTERLIESMDTNTKQKYDELLQAKTNMQMRVTQMQQKLDELCKQQLYLEEEIALSPLKQEAVKLYLKVIEAEEKRDMLKEEEKNRISPEEEKEKLLEKIKQDNVDIAAAEAQLSEKKKRMLEVEQKLEQLETDIDDVQSEKQMKYKELLKREETIEQFMTDFEENKDNETKKLHKLENSIVEYLENISNMMDNDINFTGNNEMDFLNNLPSINESELDNMRSFENMVKENTKLQQILGEMELLEQKLNKECTNLSEKISNRENTLIKLDDLDNLKAKLAIKQKELAVEYEKLKHEELELGEDHKTIQSKYNEIKERLESNDAYQQVITLENTMEKLREEHKRIENSISQEKELGNYVPIKRDAFMLIKNYNTMLKENLKIIY